MICFQDVILQKAEYSEVPKSGVNNLVGAELSIFQFVNGIKS